MIPSGFLPTTATNQRDASAMPKKRQEPDKREPWIRFHLKILQLHAGHEADFHAASELPDVAKYVEEQGWFCGLLSESDCKNSMLCCFVCSVAISPLDPLLFLVSQVKADVGGDATTKTRGRSSYLPTMVEEARS